ncbi:MAG: leucine-rich repeat domain-containing protein [Cyanobacteria bacterium P01_F01_bin.3]
MNWVKRQIQKWNLPGTIEKARRENATELDLSDRDLTELPTGLFQLKKLKSLDLSGNKLTTVPKELGQLQNLTRLSLFNNQLTTVPKELGQLQNLTELYLFSNQLTTVPKELGQLQNLTELYLHDNDKLAISPEVLGPTRQDVARNKATPAKPQTILDYYFRIQINQRPLNEAKLIFVGFGAVGKTSLVKRLCEDDFNPKSAKTEGIQITPWDIQLHNTEKQTTEEIILNIWDFGGQEIMHSTHQFFLTERSLYVLVLNGRQGHEDADAEYWLVQ